jgi:hypothetical protein
MNRHDEHAWRAQIKETHRRRAKSPRRLSRHYPRLRARRTWSAMPALKVALGVAVVLLLIRLAV